MFMLNELTKPQQSTFYLIKKQCQQLLDHSPRFKFFTLHGKRHIDSLLEIAEMLCENGVKLTSEEAYYLALSICVHDLGMVINLADYTEKDLLINKLQFTDPTAVENYIRENHHTLIDNYFTKHFDFLTSLGLSPPECGIIRDIAKCHRKQPLHKQKGMIKNLGALLRLIDELDIGSKRAPIAVFRNLYQDMDSISCWHWFKHNIVESWQIEHNVHKSNQNGINHLRFEIIVRPPKENSIPYWLNQVKKPILKVLNEENVSQIISDKWGLKITVNASSNLSSANPLGKEWEEFEVKALSSGRKVILVIDDEARKLEDLFFPLTEDYHIVYSPNPDSVTASSVILISPVVTN